MQIFVVFVLITFVAALVIRLRPDRYRSETLIMVVPQRVPESYVRSTVTARIEDRLRSINQQITSRTRLEPVIKEFNLYPADVRKGPLGDVVERMRADIQTQIIRGDAFRISYVSDDALTAMKVTERLASMYIDESLRDREVLADSTNQFLDSQLATAKERLVAHEKKLEKYNTRYSGKLPSQVQANLQVMQNAQLQIQSIVDSLSRDKDRRLTLDGTLADLGESPADGSAQARAVDAPPAPPGPAEVRLAAAQKELAAARKELEDLRLRFKPTHPDVIRMQRVIADLQRKAADQAAIATLEPQQAPAVAASSPAETARLSRIAQVRGEIDSLGRQIAQKEQEEVRLRAVVADYQARVEAAPARESELTELTRDYETLQRSYTSLLSKKEDAQVSVNLERHQIGEQFKILDPARLPEKPISPNRPLFYGLGAAIGLGCGLLLAGWLEYRDTSLKTDADVVTMLALPVLAMIPELMTTEAHDARLRRRRTLRLVTAGTAAVLTVILVWVWRM